MQPHAASQQMKTVMHARHCACAGDVQLRRRCELYIYLYFVNALHDFSLEASGGMKSLSVMRCINKIVGVHAARTQIERGGMQQEKQLLPACRDPAEIITWRLI